jgi:ribonuclease J
MPSLTFYGGVNEIGGNKILLEDEGTKIFLDFGMGFQMRGKFFEEFLTPRTANGIGDFLVMGLIPDIEGVYREDLLKHFGRKPRETPEIDAVFLSHAHADHANYVSFLHEDIPIYCGETCRLILEAIEEQSKRSIENEVLNFKPRPLRRCDYKKPPVEREFKTFKTGEKVKIDNLEIIPVEVDHSVPGAYGFIIHTSEGTIVYTGDLRLHGNNPQLTNEFLEKAQDSETEIMISEGTRIDIKEEDNTTERTVYNTAKSIIKNTKKLAIVDFNFKDVTRFRTFYKIAQELKRKIVISFKHACFLDKYSLDKKLNVPNSRDKDIRILKPKLGTGTYNDEEDYCGYKFIRSRLDYGNIITAEEIKEKQEDYMVVLNFYYFNNLIDLRPEEKSSYIHSLSEPFNEEMEISYERMKNWLDYFHLNLYQAHCSGHAPASDLKQLIEGIKPRTLFPIHTEHPELFQRVLGGASKRSIKIIRTEQEKKYEI